MKKYRLLIDMMHMKKWLQILIPLLFFWLTQCVNEEKGIDISFSNHMNNIDSLIVVSKTLTMANPDSAISILERLLEIPEQRLQKEQRSQIYQQLGITFSIKKELDKSDLFYKKALDILEYKEYPCLLSQIYINLGINESKRGHFDKSTSFYKQAKAVVDKQSEGCDDLLNRIYNNLGIAYQNIGKLDTAIFFYEQVYHSAKEKENKLMMANTLVNMSVILHHLGNFEQMEQNLIHAIPLYKKEADKERVMKVYMNLAVAYTSMKDYNKALTTFEKADSLAKELNLLGRQAAIYNNIGNIYFEEKKYKESLEYAEKSLNIKRQFKDSIGMAYSLNAISAIYCENRNYNEAKKIAKEGVLIAQSANNTDLLLNLYKNLSTTLIYLGEKNEAIEFITKRDELKDSLFSKQKIEAIHDLQTKYETAQKEQEILQLTEQKKIQQKISRLYAGLIILLIILLILSIVWMRNRRKKTEQEIEQLKYRTVKSKFIPHFTGNVLNSINYLISKNPETAQQYIADFSIFTNKSLYYSEKLSCPLKDELDYVETYLKLEKLRFEDDLNYIINISPEVHQQINIPTMILHTFCENALKHGLRHKNGGGTINICVSNQKQFVLISVEDDGIGREKARELKTEGNQEGLKIVEQQIKLFNKNHKGNIIMKIKDLYTTNQSPAGVRFELYIPTEI